MPLVSALKRLLCFFCILVCFVSFSFSAHAEPGDTIVYVTKTGHCYHLGKCHYLRQSCIKTTLEKAYEKGYSACSVCKPPRLDEDDPFFARKERQDKVNAAIETVKDGVLYAFGGVSIAFFGSVILHAIIRDIFFPNKYYYGYSSSSPPYSDQYRSGAKYYFWDIKRNEISTLQITEVSKDTISFCYRGKIMRCSKEYAQGKFYFSAADVPVPLESSKQ